MSTELSSENRYRLIEECFGSVLEPFGFTTKGSKKGVFWRKTESGLYHYVVAWRALRKPKFEILVFAFHPSLDNEFESKHPDEIGCPINGYLHSKRGVGASPEQLFCKTEDGFRRDFEKRGKGMLVDHAVPFLNSLQKFSDLEPLITAIGIKKNLTNSST